MLVDAALQRHSEAWLRDEIFETAGLAYITSPQPDAMFSKRTIQLITKAALTVGEADELVDGLHEGNKTADADVREALLRLTVGAARLGAPFSTIRVGRLVMEELRARP